MLFILGKIMSKHLKKFIGMGLFILLTNLFWETISQQLEKNSYVKKSMNYVKEIFESKEPPFHAIDSLQREGKELQLILKQEAFVYLFAQSPTETKLLFPNQLKSFNQINPNTSFPLLADESGKKLYLVASREPLIFKSPKIFLEGVERLKRLGKVDFVVDVTMSHNKTK